MDGVVVGRVVKPLFKAISDDSISDDLSEFAPTGLTNFCVEVV
jgi:hypothetical protein